LTEIQVVAVVAGAMKTAFLAPVAQALLLCVTHVHRSVAEEIELPFLFLESDMIIKF
jgi:hypothetical protein